MIVGPRLAFEEANDVVLCGNGNWVEVREKESKSLKHRFQAFDTTIVCGICLLDSGYLCYGDSKLVILNSNFEVLIKMNMHSWISAVKVLENGNIIVLTAASILYRLNGGDFTIEKSLQLESFGILISGFIIGNNWENLSVFVGVFDYIKLFYPYKSTKAVNTFIGHTGMIFAFAESKGVLYSISDDRSLRAWNPENGQEIASAFGHSSRPFAIQVLDTIGILTGGADQTVCIWKLKDKSLNLLHRVEFDGGPIRSLCLMKDQLLIGSDTGSLFSLQLNGENSNVELAVSFDNRKINAFIGFPNQKFVLLVDSRELWIYSNSKQRLLCNEFTSKSKLSKLPVDDYFAASTVNSIFIYNFAEEKQIFSLNLDYSLCVVFWLGNYLFASDSDQKCHIYEFSNETLVPRATFDLERKMAFIGSGCFYKNSIILGTSRGSLFILNGNDFGVIKVIHGFHGKFAITDLKIIDEKLYSIGKDEKFKQWEIFEEMNLKLYNSNKIDYPVQLILDSNGNLKFIASFNGNEFILVNAQNFLPVFQTYCGGSHRTWKYDLNDQKLDFINGFKLYSAKNNGLAVKNIEGSWHQSEFTTLEIYPYSHDKYLICTAGNDTQIAVSEYCSITDKIDLKFKSKMHVGSISDMTICNDLLISVGANAEFYLWKISKTDYTIRCLDKQRLDFDARLLAVNARLVNNSLFVTVVSSFGSITLFEYLNENLINKIIVELDGVSSYTKVCFIDDNSFVSVTTGGNLIFYGFKEKIIEQKRVFIEKNSLTALCVKKNIVAIGSTSGQISILPTNNEISTILVHGSTVTDIQCNFNGKLMEIISISLDRCVVVSQFDISSNEFKIIKTIAHCIYDPSRLRMLTNDENVERKCIITGYGMQTVSI